MKKNLDITKPRYSEQILPVPSPFIILLRFYCNTAVHADADVMVNFESGEKDDFSVSDRGSSPVAIAVLWLLNYYYQYSGTSIKQRVKGLAKLFTTCITRFCYIEVLFHLPVLSLFVLLRFHCNGNNNSITIIELRPLLSCLFHWLKNHLSHHAQNSPSHQHQHQHHHHSRTSIIQWRVKWLAKICSL